MLAMILPGNELQDHGSSALMGNLLRCHLSAPNLHTMYFTRGRAPAPASTSSRSVLPRTAVTAAAGGGSIGLRMDATALPLVAGQGVRSRTSHTRMSAQIPWESCEMEDADSDSAGLAREFAFLTGSQVTLLMQGPHWESKATLCVSLWESEQKLRTSCEPENSGRGGAGAA